VVVRAFALLLSAACAATAVLAQSSTEPLPPGNDSAGAVLFVGKGACQTCHRVRDTGSRLGPDLSDIGMVRTPEELASSLLDPAAEILPENRFYRVVTRDGASITGRLLNHDVFQVLMIDPKEQLRHFQKSELRSHGFVEGSNMPSYRSLLSRQELADVIAYLTTLKGVTPQ
jgi:putative heme-binding domain-containing protein